MLISIFLYIIHCRYVFVYSGLQWNSLIWLNSYQVGQSVKDPSHGTIGILVLYIDIPIYKKKKMVYLVHWNSWKLKHFVSLCLVLLQGWLFLNSKLFSVSSLATCSRESTTSCYSSQPDVALIRWTYVFQDNSLHLFEVACSKSMAYNKETSESQILL